MTINVADRVRETTTSTGTGNITLAGAATGFQTYDDAFSDSDRVGYVITDGTDWEIGHCTFSSPSTLNRSSATVVSSSNGGSKVSWSAGTKDVFNFIGATNFLYLDESGNINFPADSVDASAIATGAVVNAKIGASAVTAAKIDSNAVTTGKINAAAVTTAKIQDAAVTTAKIAASAINASAIDTDAVTTAKIQDGAVTAAKIGTSAVVASALNASSITPAMIKASTNAPGSTNFLRGDGTWQPGGVWQEIGSEITFSADTTVLVSSITQDVIVLEIIGFQPSVNDATFQLKIGNNGTILATGYTNGQTATTTEWEIQDMQSAQTNSLRVQLNNLQTTGGGSESNKNFLGIAFGDLVGAPTNEVHTVGGKCTGMRSSVVTEVQLELSSGNFADGTMRVFGMTN